MNAATQVSSRFLTWSAALLLAGAAACSAPPTDTGFGGDGTGTSANGGMNTNTGGPAKGNPNANGASSSGGTGGNSGSAASGGSTSSSGQATGSSGSTSGRSSSGSSAGSSSGGVGAGDGGSSSDLAPPAAGTGIQIATPDYKAGDPNASQMIVQPGQEIFLCYYVTLPNQQVEVGAFQSWMSPGSSHHFIVFQGGNQTNGTIQSCPIGIGQWIYATSTPGQVVGMNMPQGVGYPFPASTQLILNMHFINTTSGPLVPKVKLNIVYATNVQYQAAAMVSFNAKINVPAATAAGPGTQTVSGTCTAPAGSKFFVMSTHTHKHATAAIVTYTHLGQTQEIVHTGTTSTYPADQEQGTGTDWEHPGVGQWGAPNFLTVQSGDSFGYSCAYSNPGSTPVTVGETAASNEMCMAIGYYYPAGSTSCN
ncbi:MAG TPA: hypothetical protein VKU41_20705 [Polyangiaceae bacterium]|nr:hypothetical protein [Polyangiaceae bacterium]